MAVSKTIDQPLAGMCILVTRARDQAATLCQILEGHGARTLAMPTIAIKALDDDTALLQTLQNLASYDYLLLTSANTVSVLKHNLERLGMATSSLAKPKIAVIGTATAKALRKMGLHAQLIADEHRAEGLLDALSSAELQGKRIVLLRAAKARDILPETLRERGAFVEVVAAYETILAPPEQWQDGCAALRAKAINLVTFTSASTVENFAHILASELHTLLEGVAVASIGPVTSRACIEQGLRVTLEAKLATIPDLATAIVQHVSHNTGINNPTLHPYNHAAPCSPQAKAPTR